MRLAFPPIAPIASQVKRVVSKLFSIILHFVLAPLRNPCDYPCMQQDAYSSFTSNLNATADRTEDAQESLLADLRWFLKRRHSRDYRRNISGVISELRAL